MSRISIIVGHYGSGKTEYALNLIVNAAENKAYKKFAICDLDIANPYFRSRELQQELEEKGIRVISNAFGYDITEDLPAVSSEILSPLQNEEYRVILDVGGNDTGAMILNQYYKYLTKHAHNGELCFPKVPRDEIEMLLVVNANRPETDTVEKAIEHKKAIEEMTNLKITGLINNSHMLRETSVEDVKRGHKLCEELSKITGLPLKNDLVTEEVFNKIDEEERAKLNPYIIKLYHRPSWLDR
ncbi:MAG: ATP-binding protein [Anaerovoracaceae bacterium]